MTHTTLKPLQSGGFADVILNQETGVCFKIFHRKGAERREFNMVRHLMDVYAKMDHEHDNFSEMSRVMKFLDYGYIPIEACLEMYRAAYPHDNEKIQRIMKNFQNESFVPFVAMEYIDGIDGLEFGLKFGTLDEATAINLMTSTLLAVQEFHSMGLIHRDIKPDNFIVYKNEFGKYDVKLIDLGLAVPSKDEKLIYEANIGTQRYQSPEALKGWHSRSSDLFAVAISFYLLLGSPSEFNSKYMKLLLKLTDVDPHRRGTVVEALQSLKDIQKAM